MRTLTLSDGTSYTLDWCHADKGVFNLNVITDEPFINLATKFSDRQLTATITASYGDDYQTVYEGYTELQSIQKDGWQTGSVLITLFTPARVEAA